MSICVSMSITHRRVIATVMSLSCHHHYHSYVTIAIMSYHCYCCSRPDQQCDIMCDYTYQLLFGREKPFHCVAYDCANESTCVSLVSCLCTLYDFIHPVYGCIYTFTINMLFMYSVCMCHIFNAYVASVM